MPMTPARLKEYVEMYDVDLASSCAVIDEHEPELIMGLGMLGVRDNRSWITRVGVLPYTRKLGAGSDILEELVAISEKLEVGFTWLEVISGNEPAYRLFIKNRFKQTRELMVLRRPPGTQIEDEASLPSPTSIEKLDSSEAIQQMIFKDGQPNWLNQPETFRNVKELEVRKLIFDNGWEGWIFYERTLIQLKRVFVQVLSGPTEKVTARVLAWLHREYPMQDAVCENFEVNDLRIKGYLRVGYFESFRRIEMVRNNKE
ncbi:MAG: hypothetical protein ACI9EW_002677 [Cellvibrionaceae bacterium]|jgi:hypothetical protein